MATHLGKKPKQNGGIVWAFRRRAAPAWLFPHDSRNLPATLDLAAHLRSNAHLTRRAKRRSERYSQSGAHRLRKLGVCRGMRAFSFAECARHPDGIDQRRRVVDVWRESSSSRQTWKIGRAHV